ncbi:hypothetical protein BBF96_10910 [Anoxybacter fermentans]|uniref:Endolytic transglycosylase MltG n=1 Tax=Anoxybacter fermentans TaxID=1323375 RepID=A0A3S9T0A4_9FIRM|nr:hypothetical protein [Anoxybacter fermentans]AZR73852.1 hypothetical protein BBF96_10910 [Anoxybacter fermentans]
MYKGFYWSLLITGIGIGLVIAALIWVFSDQFYPGDGKTVIKPEREIVYYQISRFRLDIPDLNYPEPIEEPNPEPEPISDIKTESEPVEFNPEFIKPDIESVEEPDLEPHPMSNTEPVPEPVTKSVQVSDANPVPEHTEPVLEPIRWVEFEVKPGDLAVDIARRLAEKEIVDEKEFLRIVKLLNLDRKLRVGRYQFRKGANIYEIIAELMHL